MLDPHNNQPGQTMTTADDKARKALFAALAEAQSEMGSVFKDSTNPHFRSKYAGLPAVLNEIIPTLNRHDISFVQAPDFDADTGCVILRTALRHKDGAEIVETTAAPIGKKLDPQAFGSAVTYLRRYTRTGPKSSRQRPHPSARSSTRKPSGRPSRTCVGTLRNRCSAFRSKTTTATPLRAE
jgi:hypothetical protein